MPLNFESNASPTPPPPSSRPDLPPPVPNPLRQDHSLPVGEQHSVDVNNLPKNAGNNLFQSDNSSAPLHNPDYDFIMNSSQTKHPNGMSNINLPKSLWAKAAVGVGALIIVIIMISVIGSIFKGPSNLQYYESVLQDQQELVHICSNATNETDISTNNQNFVATASIALASNSSQLQSYLSANGIKVSSSVLNLKVNTSTDNMLKNAETAGTFNSTFDQVANQQLSSYLADLRQAYFKTTGPHGRALLANLVDQANLLVVALSNGS